MRSHALLCLSIAVLGSGCSISSLLEKSNEEAEKTVDIICGECGDLFPDFAECEDLFGGQFLDDDDCTVEALELDKDASRETLNCIIDAQKDYNACLEDKLDCGDPNSWTPCQDIIDDAVESCPELPNQVQEALAACR
ncbi:MAG TPA: hypothetical protein VM869_15145 [Enhygromyxa sp.]|nr:hypothetical protein [Enhygromyxa sp.]